MELKEWLEKWIEGNLRQARSQGLNTSPPQDLYWHGQIVKLEQLQASVQQEVWKIL